MNGKRYDFDQPLDRRLPVLLNGIFCQKVLGVPEVIPMWVAYMDFPAPPEVVEAYKRGLSMELMVILVFRFILGLHY